MRRLLPLASSLCLAFVLWAVPVQAQEELGLRRFGVRLGATVDPDQVHLGAHVNAGEFTENLRFQPSFEAGFGNDLIVAQLNLDGLYFFRPRPWTPYLGAGLGVAFIDRDRDFRNDDDLDVEAGLNLVGGFEWGDTHQYLLEARVGVGDIPDFKVTVGFNF